MDYNSEEDASLSSEYEMNEYKNKTFEKLQAGKILADNVNGTLKCPLCPGKKKPEYILYDLLQHANRVGRGSVKRSVKQRAKYLASCFFLRAKT